MKFILVLIAIIPLFSFGQEPSNVDSFVIKFLRNQPNTPVPFLKVTRNGRKGTISRNYFWKANEPIIKDSLMITTYLFGSAASHEPTYILIKLLLHKKEEYKIINNETVEGGIQELLQLIKPYHLSNSQKAQLINQLSFAYY